MEKQTFVNQMKARGYETTPPSPTGDVTATKGDITIRLVPLAYYVVHIDTPVVTAIVGKDATDVEALRILDGLTA